MSIEISWWIVPLMVTVTAFVIAFMIQPEQQSRSGYIPDLISPLFGFIHYLVAIIVSLFSWLIWALL